jgi:GNAT superfamily N-acetyltransferase
MSQKAVFLIRPATFGDAAALSRLATDLGYPSGSEETADRLCKVLDAPNHHVMVAESPEHEAIGWAHVFGTVRVESDPFAELGGLIVAEAWRGRGAGALLVAAAEDWARANGYRKLRIRSRVDRTESHLVFQQLGFRASKTQRIFDRSLAEEVSSAGSVRVHRREKSCRQRRRRVHWLKQTNRRHDA